MSEAGSVEAMMRSPPGFPSFVTSPGVVDHTRVSQNLLEPQFLFLQPCLQTKHLALSSQVLRLCKANSLHPPNLVYGLEGLGWQFNRLNNYRAKSGANSWAANFNIAV